MAACNLKVHCQYKWSHLPEASNIHFESHIGFTASGRVGELRFDSQLGQQIFLSFKASRTTLGATQPHIQWVPGALSPGVKRQGRQVDHSPQYTVKVTNGGAILPLLHTSSRLGA
jgi:hypothetical protein